jgi:hypothetical protein
MVGVSSAAACRGVSPSLDPHSHPHFTHTLSYTLTYSPPCLTYLPPSTGARPSPIQLRRICTDIETIWCGAGDDVILSDPHYFLPFHARAMTYVDVMVLAADTFMQVSGRLTEQFTLTFAMAYTTRSPALSHASDAHSSVHPLKPRLSPTLLHSRVPLT